MMWFSFIDYKQRYHCRCFRYTPYTIELIPFTFFGQKFWLCISLSILHAIVRHGLNTIFVGVVYHTFCHNYLVHFFFVLFFFKNLLLSLLFFVFLVENRSSSSKKQMTKGQVSTQHSEKSLSSEKIGHLSVWVIPFVLHLGFLALTALFIMHVQVCILLCPQFAICNVIRVAKLYRKCLLCFVAT